MHRGAEDTMAEEDVFTPFYSYSHLKNPSLTYLPGSIDSEGKKKHDRNIKGEQ